MGNVIPVGTRSPVCPSPVPSDRAAEGWAALSHPHSPFNNIVCRFQLLYCTYESSALAKGLTILLPTLVYNYLAIYHPYFPRALFTTKAEYILILLLNKLGIL